MKWPDELLAVFRGEQSGVWFANRDVVPEPFPNPVGVLCGSFNPLHAGHRELRRVAERVLEGPVCYEMSIRNADKPTIDQVALNKRLRQFEEHPVWLTNAATFLEKARLRAETTFVLGADTAARLIQPRFYYGEESRMLAALGEIRDLGCGFLVAGRLHAGAFRTGEGLDIPADYRELFVCLGESEFRADISSTELRRSMNAE